MADPGRGILCLYQSPGNQGSTAIAMATVVRLARRANQASRAPRHRNLYELLIDCEEDRTLRAVLIGMLREVDR